MVALKTLDEETYELPLSRIGSASNAARMVSELIDNENIRSPRRTKIQGLLDGNQPWSTGTLRSKGQGHRTSLNLREGEGTLEAAKTPYYDLVFEVPRFANITLDFDYVDPDLNLQWSDIYSDEFHKVLKRWCGFDTVMQLHQYQMVAYGIGPTFWPHPIDWRPQAGKTGKILVPDRTKADIEKFTRVVILHSYTADELWQHVKGKQELKDATASGWNPDLCKEEIARAGRNAFGGIANRWQWEDFQTAFRNGDVYMTSRCEDIEVASLYVKEFSGKISHYIIPLNNPPKNAQELLSDTQLKQLLEKNETADDLEVGYLYKKREKYDYFYQIVCPFFFDIGPDGTMHSIKGLGPKIYDFCDVSNRMTSQMIDGAVLGSGVAVEAQDANALQETQVALFGGVAVFAPGLKVVQTRIAESLNGALAVRRDLQNTLQSNTGQYRQRVSGENIEPTLGQAQMNAQQQAMLSKGAVNRYYNSLNGFYKEILRRLLLPEANEKTPGGPEAVKFRDCLMKRGIPEEYVSFDHVQDVEAVPSIGYGSPQMRDIASQQLMALLPFMNEKARNTALRMRTAAIPGVGQQMCDVLFPRIDKAGFPDDHAALATVENNGLHQASGAALVTPQQNHATHFTVHFKDAMQHLQAMQQGMADPHEVVTHLENAGPHMKQHLDQIANDPSRKQQVAQMQQAWIGLSKVADKLKQQIAKFNAQPENQPQPQVDPQLMADLQKVQGELQIKAMKAKGDMALKQQKQEFNLRLADQKAASEIRRGNLTAVSNIRRSNVQTASEIHSNILDSLFQRDMAQQNGNGGAPPLPIAPSTALQGPPQQ